MLNDKENRDQHERKKERKKLTVKFLKEPYMFLFFPNYNRSDMGKSGPNMVPWWRQLL